MNCLVQSEDFELLVSCNSIRERQRSALRLHIGRGRRLSVEEASVGSGVKVARINAAMRPVNADDYRALKQEELASLAKFLGPSFASHYLELSGLGAFELMDGQIPLPKVLSSAEQHEDIAEERKRLIRRLAELEDVN
jgi:hypothetical protein